MKIIWSEQSLDDLQAVYDYISRDSSYYASNTIDKLISSADRLSDYPESGRIVPEVADPSIREIIASSHRVIYIIGNDTIRILTVIHSRQDFEGSL
jgi:addiction module RelE/StbE family toxin